MSCQLKGWQLGLLLLLLILPPTTSFLAPLKAQSPHTKAATKVFSSSTGDLPPQGVTKKPKLTELSGFKPGKGGVWPGDPNAKKYKVTVVDKRNNRNYTMDIPEDRFIFWAFEEEGLDLPFINREKMCRNGCCTTCAVKVVEGDVKMEAALGLMRHLKKAGYALSCCSMPKSDVVIEMQDEDEVYIKQFGDSFAKSGVEWGGFLIEDD